jgi:quinol monooxygenase YgiN
MFGRSNGEISSTRLCPLRTGPSNAHCNFHCTRARTNEQPQPMEFVRELAAEPLTSVFLLSVVTALILRALWRLQARLLESAKSAELLCMNATLFIKPERRHDFLECIRRAEAETNQEPLAVLYLYGEDEQTPNTFHVHQEYKGREGFDAHRRTEHYDAWRRFAATDPFTAPPEGYVFAAALVPSAAAPTEPPLLCLNVRLTVKPERREEFLREIAADQRGTMRDEPLARRMLVGEDEDAPNTFHLHEQARTPRRPTAPPQPARSPPPLN